MMILRKKEIVAAAMVVLVGMAGYLNWHYQDNITVRDGESYVEAGKKIGETQLVMKEEKSGTTIEESTATEQKSEDYFEKAKYDRELSRSKSLEILNKTAENDSFDTEIRKKAQDEILRIAENVENEVKIENLAKAKGYKNICVYISEENVNITVQKDEFSESDAAKIQEIATEQLKILPNKIKIVEVQ
ncbi:MAG: SpoIIIAH-like family protein [Clostridia bacterium]|nr:SpoIIIAH-like family protein [Clostridia bacterium]